MSVKKNIKKIISKTGLLPASKQMQQYKALYAKYGSFTMTPENYYVANLRVAEKAKGIEGDVVECGVWRGGMIAGIAELLGKNKHYYLYDSFEGLPPAKEIDGDSAIQWQNNKEGEKYYDNCKAEIEFAQTAMKKTGVPFTCVKGWFDATVPLNKIDQISLLRLDGDWYDSTMVCLQHLFPKVVSNGIIIIDDYYIWDGCSRAVHDYLSSIRSASRIFTGYDRVAYIIKKD